MYKMRKLLSVCMLLILLAGILTGCQNEETKRFESAEDFENAKIGVFTGAAYDTLAKVYLPNAERYYFRNLTDMTLSLRQGKIDGLLLDEAFYMPMTWDSDAYSYVEMDMPATEYAVAFPKTADGEALKRQMDAFIVSRTESGWLAELAAKWISASEPNGAVDLSQLTGENGTLRVATTVENKPFDFLQNDQVCGFDVDLLFEFAKEYGYALELDVMDFAGLFPSLSAGRNDLAVSGLTVTEERKESVLFSEVYYKSPIVMVVQGKQVQNTEKTLADFENATIGIFSGSSFDALAKTRFPNAQRQYYTLVPDMIMAVEQGKVDGYITETTYVTAAIWEGAEIEAVKEIIDRTSAGFIFKKDASSDRLREQLNAFIQASAQNGTIEALQEKWFAETEPTGKLDYDSLTGENGTLRLGVAPDLKPISYIKDGEATGYEMELLYLFAKEYGYKLDMSYVTFDAILPGVTTGRYDIGTGAITITEERAQSINFSDSHLTVDVVMVVKAAEDQETTASFWDEVKESFHKTFIRENRWKLILQGIGVTLLISLCSTVTGTLFGFALYMLSRSDAKLIRMLANGFAKGYTRIIAGTPVVVILMILFYVVFGQIRDMSGIVVAILGFTLTFGAFVYDHMKVAISSVDRGQTEAAYALGYTKNKTFFRIILPQAMKIFLPSYCGQAVELIKATAVVGYIAVNDLTKMGDIIRSNTYEAFFPLIATAVIYFMLTWMLSLLLKLLKNRFEPARRKDGDILKGVRTE